MYAKRERKRGRGREREREREREKIDSTAGLLNHLSGAGNFSKIWSVCRQYQLQYTK